MPRKVKKGYNDLETVNPGLAAQWHPTKNGLLLPTDCSFSSTRKVWWICKNGHEWEATIDSRNRGNGCPYCSNKRILAGFNDLDTTNPKLAKEWHPTKNGDLKPSMICEGSNKKVWWQCEKGHEWEAVVASRNTGLGCPICSNQQLLAGYNDLATTNPELAEEWHPTKNESLLPSMVFAGSGKKVWWRGKCGHEWEASIINRFHGDNCPYCSNKRIFSGYNDLQTINPILASEWHPYKNAPLLPVMVAPNSNKKVWWLGKCGHEWQAVVSSRNQGYGCPYCSNFKALSGFNDLATTNPELAKEWHPTKNAELKPNMVLAGSEQKVWWKCSYGHEWQATIASRNNGNNCPICSQRLKSSFPEQTIYYYLALVFDDAENRSMALGDSLELDVYLPSIKTAIEYDGVYWHNNDKVADREQRKYRLCKDKRIRLIRVREVTSSEQLRIDDICDYSIPIRRKPDYNMLDNVVKELFLELGVCNEICVDSKQDEKKIKSRYYSGQISNSLAKLNPALASEWHPNKNGTFTPDMFTVSSGEKVWWLGKCGHEWQASIAGRNGGTGCPYCARKKRIIRRNDLLSTNPELAAEWHPTRNGTKTHKNIGANSKQKVWWRGKCGHEWQAVVSDRNRGRGCPYCSNHRVLAGFNDLATTNPDLAKEWHPTKNGALSPVMVIGTSSKKVWWLGSCGHEWEAYISNRAKGQGCPYCSNHRVLEGFNDLATTNPQLASEWHPTKNGVLTPQMVTAKSGKKVWWLGKCGHEWATRVSHRSNGHGCPYCAKANIN